MERKVKQSLTNKQHSCTRDTHTHTSQTCDVILHLLLKPSGRILLLVEIIAVDFEQIVRRLVRLAEILQQLDSKREGAGKWDGEMITQVSQT